MVDQLPQARGASTIGGKSQARQVFQIRLVEFFRQRTAKLEGSIQQEIRELMMNRRDLFGRNRTIESHGQLASDVSDRVEAFIEGTDFIDRLIDRTRDLEKTEIFGTDQLSIQQLAPDKAVPVVPIVAAGSLKTEDGLRIALPGLGERQDFKAFIMGPEAAGKECDRIRFFLENQFSCEEVLEGDQFGIVGNCRVGPLFEWQHDIHAE